MSGARGTRSSVGSSVEYGLHSESESSPSIHGNGAPPSSSTRTALTTGFTSPATFLLASSNPQKHEKKKERRHSENRGRRSSSMSIGSSRPSGLPDQELYQHTLLGVHKRALEPLMLAVGAFDGSVDDLVFSLYEGTAQEMRQMAAYMGDDSLIDCAVLHTIKQSKSMHLAIKWKLMRTPGGNRDMCYLEYVGVANDSKGKEWIRQMHTLKPSLVVETPISISTFCL